MGLVILTKYSEVKIALLELTIFKDKIYILFDFLFFNFSKQSIIFLI